MSEKTPSIFQKLFDWMVKAPKGLNIEEDVKSLEKLSDGIKDGNKQTEIIDGWSNARILKFWLIGLAIFFVGYHIIGFINTLFLILATYIISIIMESIIRSFENKGVSRGGSIAISYILLFIFLALCILFLVPLFVSQIARFLEIINTNIIYLQDLIANNPLDQVVSQANWIPGMIKKSLLNSIQNSDQNILYAIQEYLGQIISVSTKYVGVVGGFTVNLIGSVSKFFFDLIFFIILAILFSAERRLMVDFISRLSGSKYYEKTKLQIQVIYKSLSLRLKHRLVLSLFMTLASYIVLLLLSFAGLDIPHKFAFALSIGIMDIIPYVGPFIAQMFIFAVALFDYSFGTALLFPILLITLNLIENSVVIPILMSKSLGVSLVTTFICMLIGGLIMGLLGVFLAVPFAVILTVLYKTSNKSFDFLKREHTKHSFKV